MNRNIIFIILILLVLFSCNDIRTVRLEPGFTIYLDDTSSIPVQNALRILQRDIRNVMGQEAEVKIGSEDLEHVRNVLVIINEASAHDFPIPALEGFERHKLYTRKGNLILQGADMRGTIFAIFTFSEEFLGIEPLWYWALHTPEKKNELSIPASYSYDSGEPHVKYRAWFPNDTDMFSPWRRKSPLHEEIWLETMLRLKLNTVETGRASDYRKPYGISEYAELLDRYGLVITFHHVAALNSSYQSWDDYWRDYRNMEPPELLLSNVDQLEEFWRYNVQCLVRNGIEPIWVINFRGIGDEPFWYAFRDAPESMEERAHVINTMASKQLQILKEETGNPSPFFRMIFYNELSDLLAAGLLKPPEPENLIWNFVAARRDHFPNVDIRTISLPEEAKLGYYLNFQFTSTGSHLAQAEGPWKMEKNYRFIEGKTGRTTFFSVVNAGNIREHLLSLSANAAMLWDFNEYHTDDFLVEFCQKYYGMEHAGFISGLYREFFYAYWIPKKNDLEGFDRQYIFQDLRYKQAIRQLSSRFFDGFDPDPLRDYSSEQIPNRTFRIVPADNEAENQVEAIIKGTGESAVRFRDVAQAADSIYPLLDPECQVFFNDNLRCVSHFMMYLNETLHHYCLAYKSEPGDRQLEHLEMALSAARNARKSIYESAHDQFETWYSEERIFDLDGFTESIRQTLETASGQAN